MEIYTKRSNGNHQPDFFAGLVFFQKPVLKMHHARLRRVSKNTMVRSVPLASVRNPLCDDWIMYSLKTHLYSSPNRLSGQEPAHTASVLLRVGPPETFSETVFSGSCCKWKHLTPTINYPPWVMPHYTDPQLCHSPSHRDTLARTSLGLCNYWGWASNHFREGPLHNAKPWCNYGSWTDKRTDTKVLVLMCSVQG